MITGDLRIIKNNKLRNPLKNDLNYREPGTINFSKALSEMATALDTCIETMILKTKYTTSNFKPWKEKVSGKMKEKIIELKQKIKPK